MEPIKLIPLHSGRAEVWSNGAENLSVHLTYDISNYLKSWPDAQPSVAFERADGEKYPHAWELDGPVLHIPLLLADTETPGMCKCMITMISGDGRANTMVFYGSVTEGIDSLGEEPTEPMLGVIEQVNKAAARAEAAADRAESSGGGGGGSAEQVQADWNENDETSPAYVKGRTHWVEKETAVFFPETSFTADTLTDDGWPVTSPVSNKPAAGTECTVTWNGTEYKCPVQEAEGEGAMFTIIGNGEVVGLTGNGEPFMVMLVPDEVASAMGAYGAILPLDGSTSATITMAGESEIVHPLDPKYIGDLRGQKQITITIAEDGTVTSDTSFALAFSLDERELNAAIRIVTSGHDVIAGQMVERQYSVVGVCKFDPGNGYGVISITYLPYVDLKDVSGVSQSIVNMIWMKTPQGESGFDVSLVSSLPRCWNVLPGETQYLEWSVGETVGDNNTPAGPGKWSAVTKENFMESLGLSALNTENAGKLLYIDADGNAQPLALGDGLAIVDGVLTLTGATTQSVAFVANEDGSVTLQGATFTQQDDGSVAVD